MEGSWSGRVRPDETAFGWADSKGTCAHEYLLPAVLSCLAELYEERRVRILDLGCGNGFIASRLSELGHEVTGIDAAQDGIEIARTAYPFMDFHRKSIYEDDWSPIANESFDCIVSLEVVEHLLYPKTLFHRSHDLLKKGGHLIVSTPYHGYLKNLALSMANGWDKHFDVAWDGGHVKFFSRKTLCAMASEPGFKHLRFRGVGRLPWLWKSMVMMADK